MCNCFRVEYQRHFVFKYMLKNYVETYISVFPPLSVSCHHPAQSTSRIQHATLWRNLDLESSAARLDSHALFAIAGGNLLSETRSMCLAGACPDIMSLLKCSPAGQRESRI
jgi:hypothetical protein